MDLVRRQNGHIFSLTLENEDTEESVEKLISESLEGKFSSTWRKPVRKIEKSEEQVRAFLQSQQAIVKQKFFEITVDI